MTPEELRKRRASSFCELAAQELDAAKLLSTAHRPQSAYFLQQSVEKLARGLLEVLDVPVGTTHNIGQLARLMEGKPEWSVRFLAMDELSVAATRYRYPGPKGNIGAIDQDRLSRLIVDVDQLNRDFGAILIAYARDEKG